MSTEKTFTVVGTSTKNGQVKVRWANDLVSRIKILNKAGDTDVDLIELSTPMTKLEAAQYFLDNKEGLSDAQREILEAKIAEKGKAGKRREVKATLTDNVNKRIKDKAPTDPRVDAFVEKHTESAE